MGGMGRVGRYRAGSGMRMYRQKIERHVARHHLHVHGSHTRMESKDGGFLELKINDGPAGQRGQRECKRSWEKRLRRITNPERDVQKGPAQIKYGRKGR